MGISLEGREADKADIWNLDVAPRKPATEESRQRKIKKPPVGVSFIISKLCPLIIDVYSLQRLAITAVR